MLFLCCNSNQEREQLLLKDQVSRGVHIPDNHWGQEQSQAEKESKYLALCGAAFKAALFPSLMLSL